MTTPTAAQLRQVAIDATLSVRDQLLAAFRAPMLLDYKADRRDIVTIHDKAAEKQISEYLLSQIPDSTIIGEEDGIQGNGAVRWYVDPIDGTANFARGLPAWCVSIGAQIDQEMVAAAILDPVGNNIFSADTQGAYLGKTPMMSQAAPNSIDATLVSTYPSARDLSREGKQIALGHFAHMVEAFSAVRRNGSAALGLAHVAAGWCDSTMGFGIKSWDIAAGEFILRQAGGSYHSFGRADPTMPTPFHPGYVGIGAGGDYPTLLQTTKAIADYPD